MIKCYLDPSVPQDSKCAYCCLYCDEKEDCNYYCSLAKGCKTEEEVIKKDCVHAFMED